MKQDCSTSSQHTLCGFHCQIFVQKKWIQIEQDVGKTIDYERRVIKINTIETIVRDVC